LDLMMKVIIIILVILVVMIILLFFVLWPFIPVILSVVAIIGTTAMGGAVGGMSSTFCFEKSTQIQSANRGAVPIEELRNGDVLANGAVVQGTMTFKTSTEDLYNLHGIHVSGSHIVFQDDIPYFVNELPAAEPVPPTTDCMLYCLITSTHRIPVLTSYGEVLEFADWEEISSESDLKQWHEQVFTTLNAGAAAPAAAPSPAAYEPPSADILHSEAVVSGRTKIWTSLGPVAIRGIRPGDVVLDVNGKPTIVKGVVCVEGSQVRAAAHLGGDAWISAAAWKSYDGLTWNHPEHEHLVLADGIHEWYSLFTESGTFRLCEVGAIGLNIRDFTDIGPDRIQETYDWVLESLESQHLIYESDAPLKTDH
jgi:hypothetical protein